MAEVAKDNVIEHPAKRRREALQRYEAALEIADPREQLRARFAALMALVEARGG